MFSRFKLLIIPLVIVASLIAFIFFFKRPQIAKKVRLKPIENQDLVGVWHQSSDASPGKYNRYHFYSSGKYTYFPWSESKQTKKPQKGYWQLNNFLLTFSLLSDSSPEEIVAPLDNFNIRPDDTFVSMDINGKTYWKISSDPYFYGDDNYPEN